MRSKTFTWSKLRLALGMMAAVIGIGAKDVNAQNIAGNYSFTQTSGTFTPITGGTVINAGIPDSYQSGAIVLTPAFTFCGVSYDTAYMTSNGLISLDGTTGPGTTQYNGIANGGGSGILLCPFNANLIASSLTGAAPQMRYQLVGNEHVFQWTDASRSPATTDRFSFQARLNAVTGVITYVYTVTSVGTATTNQPIIGIRTANTPGNWQSRFVANDATSSWAASVLATTTTDVVRFTSSTTNPKQPVNGQTYIYTPPPPCTAVTAPAASAITANPLTICVSGTVNLNLPVAMPTAVGYTYQWQRSTTVPGGPYVTVGVTTSPSYATTTNVSAYYRCRVLCNNDSVSPFWTSTPTAQVVVNNPGTPTVTGGSRCGPGVVGLSAVPPAGSTISWYDVPTGGVPLGTGTTLTTPSITQTTTYYAAAGSGSTTINCGRPAPQATSSTYAFFVNYGLIFDATQSFTIQSVDVYHTGATPGSMYVLLKNSAGVTLQTAGPFTLPTGTGTTVGGGATPTVLPININVPGAGTGYRLVDSARVGSIIRDNPVSGWSYPLPIGAMGSITGALLGGSPSTGAHYYYYNWVVITGCQGARVPVVATVNPSPVVTKTAPAVVCNNAVATIALTPPAPAYPNYTWTPTTNLFTDAAATIPYTGGSATTVYMKTTNVGTQTYYMMAGNPNVTTGCTFADTVRIWSQPGNVTIKAFPDTICVSGTSSMTLDTNAGYYAGSIQWQDSIPGVSASFTNIAGANSPAYVTPNLTFGQNRYYRAQIRSGATICQAPVKYIVIANPTIINAPDSFNCGPGTVTLSAQVGGNGVAQWYDSPTANIPVGSGSPWTTPYLGTTTTYYLASSSGTPQPPPTFMGSGTTTSSTTYTPYYRGSWGQKTQYLIRASELLAAGFSAGQITSIGFNVTTAGANLTNLTFSMGHTTLNALPATYQTGLQPVYTAASFTPVANSVNDHVFQTPFYWNGVDNIILEKCANNPNTGTSTTVTYSAMPAGTSIYSYNNVNDHCSNPTSTIFTTSSRPNIRVTMRGACESPREPVIAYIHPKPVVDLGPDINECVDAGAVKILDAGVQPHNPQFLWDNGSISQVRAVNTSGTYMVTVTNQYTCANSDTINVILRKNPVVELGNDTTVCNGVVLALDAGNEGISYFWNTGQTTQEINVSNPGSYNVFVTNNLGCTKADTIVVNMAGELPTISGINISNNGVNTFYFTAVNPQNVIGYDWDFGDGTPHSYQASPTHTYANSGNYVVVLRLSSTCGFYDDSTSAHIVGINPVNVGNEELMVYPNPSRETATILNKSGLKMERIEMYNILGQVVYRSEADSKDKHILKMNALASGIYTIQVYTDKGTIARKLEVLK